MIKLLIGGSPCTFWSIAQKNGRETEAEGMGWELFKNYLVAKEKFKPDFFLYENNKSAAQAIKDQIQKELGVWDETLLMEDTGARYIEINSALVSAQNRQRFYVHNCGDVGQPEDRGILLRDILETTTNELSYELAEPVGIGYRGRMEDGKWVKRYESREDQKANAITTAQTDSMVGEPVRIPEYGVADKSRPVTASYAYKGSGEGSLASEAFPDNPNKQVRDYIAEPVRVGCYPSPDGTLKNSQGMRLYSIDGKSVNLTAQGGGMGAKTGLYACPVEELTPFVEGKLGKLVEKYWYLPKHFNPYNCSEITDKTPTMTTGCGSQTNSATVMSVFPCNENYIVPSEPMVQNEYYQYCGTISQPIYEVKNGLITIKGKEYPIKLKDGKYIIRKLTPVECERLQTLPDNYTEGVSNAQRYKGLGNGWTAEVIIHILSGALKDVPKDEEIVVLSMYDGIGTGRYCLDKMGFTNVKYFAYEIDKYAKQIAMKNYPDIIQMGDAFDLRHPDWTIGY